MAYDPGAYWSKRLSSEDGPRSTGHLDYTDGYNRWLYRQKAHALDRALSGATGSAAVDLGSGSGWVVERLIARGYRVHGCDVAEPAVARLRERLPGEFYVHELGGAEPLPEADASIDLITMIDVAYHIVDDQRWQTVLAEASRVLSPNGRLIVTDTMGRDTEDEARHVRKRSRRQWDAAALKAQLRVAEVRPLFRWLSREQDLRGWRLLRNKPRGAVEYTLERLAPIPPHMRIATLVRR